MNNQNFKVCEFLLTLDGNIIVQRMFNVRGFNPNVKKSLDLYNTVTHICDRISEDMKKKNFEYMTENEVYFTSDEYQDEDNLNKKDDFLLEIKSEDDVFIQRTFPAYVYHPKVKVDIRHMLKEFLYDLTETLSSNDLETSYLDKELDYTYMGENEKQ